MSSVREVYIAAVTDNADPEQRGRIKVACAGLMGMDADGEPVEYPQWVSPVFPMLESSDGAKVDSGIFGVPNPGTTVEIEITTSNKLDRVPGQSSISNPDPRWRACLLQPGDALSTDLTKNYPERKGWRTKAGHLLMFDDSLDAERRVTLRHGGPKGDGAGAYVSLEPDGSIIIATAGGQLIYMNDAEEGGISLIDKNKNLVSLADGEVSVIEGKKGSMIVLNSDGAFVTTPGVCTVTANNVTLSAGSVNLGANAVESIIKGNTFQALFNAHTHPTAVGPSGPPVPLLTGAELSLVTKTE